MRIGLVAIAASAALMLPMVGQAQQSRGLDFPVGVSLDFLQMRQTLNLRDSQWEKSLSGPVVQVSASTLLTRRVWLSYGLTTRLQTSEEFPPVRNLIIGGLDFGPRKEPKTKGKEEKPVTIDYASGCDHAVALIGKDLLPIPIQPVVMGKWAVATVSATGERKGEPIQASEEFRKFFPAVGLSFRQQNYGVTTNIMFAASDRYTRVEGSLATPVYQNISLRLGGFYEHMDMGELKVRNSGWLVGGEAKW